METLFITEALQKQHPNVALAIQYHCWWNGVIMRHIQGTPNVWARDYMPVHTNGTLTKFRYDAYGYRKLPRLQVPGKCFGLVRYRKSDIYLDGGNVEQNHDTVLMCDMVFRRNPHIPKPKLARRLEKLFGKRVVFVPSETCDTLGHIDGTARFSDLNCVLVNDYSVMKSKVYDRYQKQLETALEREGLRPARMPYAYNHCPQLTDRQFRKKYPMGDDNNPGVGYYINFIKTDRLVLVPQFKFPEDKLAIDFLRYHFPKRKIVGVDCFDLAMTGGLLNCVSFN